MNIEDLKSRVINALEDLKGKDIVTIDVKKLTSLTDVMIICSGTSNRHVQALAQNVITEIKKQGFKVLGVEGTQEGEWILIDLGDVIVHVMQVATREFYNLEKLWVL